MITVVLGTKVVTSLTDVRLTFEADAPVPLGPGDFTSTVSDGPFTRSRRSGIR